MVDVMKKVNSKKGERQNHDNSLKNQRYSQFIFKNKKNSF